MSERGSWDHTPKAIVPTLGRRNGTEMEAGVQER